MPVVMATDQVMVQTRARVETARSRSAFTLVDLAVSIAIIGVLIGLMLPGLSGIRETTRRVVCGSNLRQHGLGLAMYADDFRGALAPSVFASYTKTHAQPDGTKRDIDPNDPNIGKEDDPSTSQQTVLARTAKSVWEGLGWLYSENYVPAPGVFYCPSHHGDFPMRAIVPFWRFAEGELVTNYQYRGGDSLESTLFNDRTALVSDAMRTVEEFNHVVGSNVLRRDLSVTWFVDRGGVILSNLAMSTQQPDAGSRVDDAWNKLDGPGR